MHINNLILICKNRKLQEIKAQHMETRKEMTLQKTSIRSQTITSFQTRAEKKKIKV